MQRKIGTQTDTPQPGSSQLLSVGEVAHLQSPSQPSYPLHSLLFGCASLGGNRDRHLGSAAGVCGETQGQTVSTLTRGDPLEDAQTAGGLDRPAPLASWVPERKASLETLLRLLGNPRTNAPLAFGEDFPSSLPSKVSHNPAGLQRLQEKLARRAIHSSVPTYVCARGAESIGTCHPPKLPGGTGTPMKGVTRNQAGTGFSCHALRGGAQVPVCGKKTQIGVCNALRGP